MSDKMKRGYRYEFVYKKADGSVSERDVVILSTPSDSYLTIDLTEFSKDEKEFLFEQLAGFLAEQEEMFTELLADLDLKHNYRRFKEAGVFSK